MKIIVKRARIANAAEISSLNQLCLPIYYSLLEYGYYIMSAAYEVIIAIHNNKIIGYLIGQYESNHNFHIMSFGTHTNYRNLGIGTILLTRISELIKKKCKSITLNVHVENNTAIHTYTKSNFKVKSILTDYYIN